MDLVDGHADDAAVPFVLTIMCGLVAARTECLFTRTGQHDRPDILVVASARERPNQLGAGLTAKRVVHLGSIQCDRCDMVTLLEK